MRPLAHSGSHQRGVVLVTSLLLLVVVTILAVGLFRSFGIDEKIAGNTREKQIALNAAESAEQYAEWWLSTGAGGTGGLVIINCTVPVSFMVGQACSNQLVNPSQLPWAAHILNSFADNNRDECRAIPVFVKNGSCHPWTGNADLATTCARVRKKGNNGEEGGKSRRRKKAGGRGILPAVQQIHHPVER